MKQNIPQPLIIKKYENRRLYNTSTSQYINQGQVAQLVRDGHDVRVVDAATGQDLTRLVLAQIVLEDAKTPDSVFPLDVLRQMILASGSASQENALRYMKAMTDMYKNASRALPKAMNPFDFLQGPWAKPDAAEEPMEESPPPQEFPAEPETQIKASEAAELKRRIEELESLLVKRVPKDKVMAKPKSRKTRGKA